MSDLIVIAAYAGMLFAPCAVAFQVSLADEGAELAYVASLRRLQARIADSLRS